MKTSQKIFTKHLYWPLVQKLKGEHARESLRILQKSQWLEKEGLLKKQWVDVQRTVRKAYQEVSFYRKHYRQYAAIFERSTFSYEQFRSLPIVEKKHLRDNLEDFLNPAYNGRVTVGRTSGSTGHSLVIKYDTTHESYSEAARWRAKSWWNVSIGDPHVSLWGRPYTSKRDQIEQKFKSRLMNNLIFSAFDISDRTLGRVIRQIIKFQPYILYGYPSAIFPLANFVLKNGIGSEAFKLRVVMTTAEMLLQYQRETIEKAFGCKTANEYGCSETGGFTYECPAGNWHIASELVFLEFLDKQGEPVGAGETGAIYLTHLKNDYMPLIRYRVGDRGGWCAATCSCGRGLPLMHVSVGKEIDQVRTKDGRLYSSEIFDYINLAVMNKYPASILHFRITQHAYTEFSLEVVPGDTTLAGGEQLFISLMKEQLGADITVNLSIVDQIDREPSGKLRYFISELAGPDQ